MIYGGEEVQTTMTEAPSVICVKCGRQMCTVGHTTRRLLRDFPQHNVSRRTALNRINQLTVTVQK